MVEMSAILGCSSGDPASCTMIAPGLKDCHPCGPLRKQKIYSMSFVFRTYVYTEVTLDISASAEGVASVAAIVSI